MCKTVVFNFVSKQTEEHFLGHPMQGVIEYLINITSKLCKEKTLIHYFVCRVQSPDEVKKLSLQEGMENL